MTIREERGRIAQSMPTQEAIDPGCDNGTLATLVAIPMALGVLIGAVALAVAWGQARPGASLAATVSLAALALGGAAAAALRVRSRTRRLIGDHLAARLRALPAARAAHESEARLAGIIASAMDAIITVDRHDRIIVFNTMAERVFGWSAAEVTGQPLDRLLPARVRDAHARHVGEFAATGRSTRSMGHPGQLVALRRDGREFPIEATISKATIGDELLKTVILRDVSERRQAEAERQRQADRLARYARRLEGVREIDRAILASTRLDELVVAALLRLAPLLRAGEAAVTVMSGESGPVQHRVVPDALPQASVRTLPAAASRAVDEWVAARGGLAVVDDLGRRPAEAPPAPGGQDDARHRSYLVVQLRGGSGSLGRIEAWAPDPGAFDEEALETATQVADQLAIAIQQAHLRDGLRRHASDMEARVAERTQALQEVNAELNAFAYSVSHDLRAPLRSTQGFAQALLEDYGPQLDDVGHDYATRIVAASRRMDALIQDLLAYSRLSRAEIELRPIDLDGLVRSVASLVGDLVQPVVPTIDIASPLPAVVGHSGVLSQVVQNVIGNAVKFVAPGVTPRVRIDAQPVDGHVVLSVRDNGIGISAEHHERIFRVFERLHPLEVYPGTGIGLAIVRKGVERLGGRCGVDSREGEGSRFWIGLPAAPPGARPDDDGP